MLQQKDKSGKTKRLDLARSGHSMSAQLPLGANGCLDIFVVGASAGGLPALLEIIRALPPDWPASLFVVLHTSAESPGLLPQILGRVTRLPVSHASDGEEIRKGRVYVAPPDRHLLLQQGAMRVTHGPKENGFRPAVDPLFRTAARAYGSRVVGIILSGALDDGVYGLMQIKRGGGQAIVQDPEEAFISSMPLNAIQNVQVDHVLPAAAIGPVLDELASQPALPHAPPPADPDETDPDVAEFGTDNLAMREMPGPPSPFTCPSCGGSLWELHDGYLTRFRCHVGHGYTAQFLLAEQAQNVDAALWTALRVLDENAALYRKMIRSTRQRGLERAASSYEERLSSIEQQAHTIRGALVTTEGPTTDTPPVPPHNQ
jgi:two-component system chemotaxis response regulator CheB